MSTEQQRVMAQLSYEQKIVYIAMTMDSKNIPMFNVLEQKSALNTGNIIKEMFKNNIYTKMIMDTNSKVVLL
jgi:hypothetical protein